MVCYSLESLRGRLFDIYAVYVSVYWDGMMNSFVYFFFWQLQLQSLMETLSSTEPHYIRCVKPNHVLKPSIFENLNVIQQLRCGVSIFYLNT